MIVSPLGRFNTLLEMITDRQVNPSTSFLQWLSQMEKAGNVALANDGNGVVGPAYRNLLVDGGFNVWDGPRTGAYTAATGYTGCTMWSYNSGAGFANYSAQRLAGSVALNSNYRMRIQRTAASGDVGTQTLYYDLENINCFPLSGKPVTLSFYVRTGQNFSAANSILVSSIQTGTGVDQAQRLGAYTGSVITSQNNVVASLTGTLKRYQMSVLVPSNAVQVGISFAWTPTGVAGANDYVDIEQVQLEQSTYPSQFEVLPWGITLHHTRRYYWKSFPFDTAPAQNATTTGGLQYTCTIPGVFLHRLQYTFPTLMRAVPTMTPYNPNAANQLWRNTSLVADSGSPGLAARDWGFLINNPQVAGDALTNSLVIHATCDARI